MLRTWACFAIVLIAGVSLAAPVPKALKKKANAEGTWELIEFWSNGTKGDARGMTKYWVLEGEEFYVGPKQVGSAWKFTIYDADKPNLRKFGNGGSPYYSAFEVDGDTLKFCYAGNTTDVVIEAKPLPNVYYYVFQRVDPSFGEPGKVHAVAPGEK